MYFFDNRKRAIVLYCIICLLLLYTFKFLKDVIYSPSEEIFPGYATSFCHLHSLQLQRCGFFLDVREEGYLFDNINHYFKDEFYPLVCQVSTKFQTLCFDNSFLFITKAFFLIGCLDLTQYNNINFKLSDHPPVSARVSVQLSERLLMRQFLLQSLLTQLFANSKNIIHSNRSISSLRKHSATDITTTISNNCSSFKFTHKSPAVTKFSLTKSSRDINAKNKVFKVLYDGAVKLANSSSYSESTVIKRNAEMINIVIYSRVDSSGRTLLYPEELLRSLSQKLQFYSDHISLTHIPRLSSFSLTERVRLFAQTNVILAPHGAWMVNSVFMSANSLVLSLAKELTGMTSFKVWDKFYASRFVDVKLVTSDNSLRYSRDVIICDMARDRKDLQTANYHLTDIDPIAKYLNDYLSKKLSK